MLLISSGFYFVLAPQHGAARRELQVLLRSFALFIYSSFIKPHRGDVGADQQGALESFYKAQASAYDVTRKFLLHGREDMLGLVASQLKFKAKEAEDAGKGAGKRIWVDVGSLDDWSV